MKKHASLWETRQRRSLRDYEVFHSRDSRLDEVVLCRHDCFEVYLFLSGTALCRMENGSFPLERGDLLVISPEAPHRPVITAAALPCRRVALRIYGHCLKELSQDSSLHLRACFDGGGATHPPVIRLSHRDVGTLTHLFDLLLREQKEARYGRDTMRRCCVTQILLLVNRLAARGYAAARGGQDELADQVFAYINAHIGENISLERLEKVFYFDGSTLTRHFRKQLDMTIPQYVRQKRLALARNLLREGQPPHAVYPQCGFADYSGFFRAFKHQWGMSPKEFYQSILKL